MKRISPFLALALFLTVFTPISIFTGHVLFHSAWLTAFLFTGAIVNLVFFDIFLKKYFNGKGFGRMYVMELAGAFFVLYFMVFQDVDPGNHITHLAKMIFH